MRWLNAQAVALGAIVLSVSACKRERTTDLTFADEASRRPNNDRSVKVVFVNGVPVPASAAAAMRSSPSPSQPVSHDEPPMPASVLAWSSPQAWRSVEPTSPMRLAQYSIPAPDAGPSAELAVYYFGPSGAAGIDQTLQRWQSAFEGGGEAQRSVRKGADTTLHILDVTGTYIADATMAGDDADASKQIGMRLVGVIVETSEGPYYFKMLGPVATVATARSLLLEMLERARMRSAADVAPSASVPAARASASAGVR
jgi:hypothetical protein